MSRRIVVSLIGVLALVMCAGMVRAQDIGTVVAVEGKAEVGRGGVWTDATVGTGVQRLDELRTARPGGRMQVVFLDQSVLNIGEGSDLTLDEFTFEPEGGMVRSLVRFLAGKMRPLVSGYYKQFGGVYEVETATAVVGVRGTEFVIAYDPVAEVSEVVGVTGQTEVRSARYPVGRAVVVKAQELTVVARGKLPTAPQRLSDKLFRQYIEDLEFIGGGREESATKKHPLLAGNAIPPPDHVDVLPGPPAVQVPSTLIPPSAVQRPPWPLLAQVPGELPVGASPTSRTVGGLTQQPLNTIRNTGNLGIDF
jgi:hypothetical protein